VNIFNEDSLVAHHIGFGIYLTLSIAAIIKGML
jgi:hypothetical protein